MMTLLPSSIKSQEPIMGKYPILSFKCFLQISVRHEPTKCSQYFDWHNEWKVLWKVLRQSQVQTLILRYSLDHKTALNKWWWKAAQRSDQVTIWSVPEHINTDWMAGQIIEASWIAVKSSSLKRSKPRETRDICIWFLLYCQFEVRICEIILLSFHMEVLKSINMNISIINKTV